MQVEITLEKETETSSSKMVPDTLGGPPSSKSKRYVWNPYSWSTETNAKYFPGFSQLPKPSWRICPLAHTVFWGKVCNDMDSKSVLQYMEFLPNLDV